jgi:predicted amidohydrolase
MTAQDVAERLTPDLNMNEVLLWAPDLFAFTSYVMTLTSAYQLVVSPPTRETWPPKTEDIKEIMCDLPIAEQNYGEWLQSAKDAWGPGSGLNYETYFTRFHDALKALRDQKDIVWKDLVNEIGYEWRANLNRLSKEDFVLVDDTQSSLVERRKFDKEYIEKEQPNRQKELLGIVLRTVPPRLLSCWAFFYKAATDSKFDKEAPLRISDLLCNQDHIQRQGSYCKRLWRLSQALITMHAIADVASLQFGIAAQPEGNPAFEFAEKLLFGRLKEHPDMKVGGSLSTFHTERCRVLPKRHNPGVGITLRSISSNLAFYRSSVDVVWRKTRNNTLNDRLLVKESIDEEGVNVGKVPPPPKQMSVLLLPFPLAVKTKDFRPDDDARNDIVHMPGKEYGFFSYQPYSNETEAKIKAAGQNEIDHAIKLIEVANEELQDDYNVDMIVFPEASLSLDQFNYLEGELLTLKRKNEKTEDTEDKMPSIVIAGVRESRQELATEMNDRNQEKGTREWHKEGDFNFARNAVYCKYYDRSVRDQKARTMGSYYKVPTNDSEAMPKYKQYKHHRWQLEKSQIRRYGLSGVLNTGLTWWESIKIPKRRVSFLNIGDRMTISHLICEDLARQDPIAELVRHVGPSLVVTILMDGPQLKNRWSARYATVLSDDPGCSVITLTSLGMVRRHSSEFGLMSRVVALWNESGGHSREIEIAPGAEAVLLTLSIEAKTEKTADGRTESIPTSNLSLVDVIQIYPGVEKQ